IMRRERGRRLMCIAFGIGIFFLTWTFMRPKRLETGTFQLDPTVPILLQIETGDVMSRSKAMLDPDVRHLELSFISNKGRPVIQTAPNTFEVNDPPEEYYLPVVITVKVPVGLVLPPVSIQVSGFDTIEVEMLGRDDATLGRQYLDMPSFTFNDTDFRAELLLRARYLQQNHTSIVAWQGVAEFDDLIPNTMLSIKDLRSGAADQNQTGADSSIALENIVSMLNANPESGHYIRFGAMDDAMREDGGGDIFITSRSSLWARSFSSQDLYCIGGAESLELNLTCTTEDNTTNTANASDTDDSSDYSSDSNATYVEEGAARTRCSRIVGVWIEPIAQLPPDHQLGFMDLSVVDGGIYVTAIEAGAQEQQCLAMSMAQSERMESFDGLPGGFDTLGGSKLDMRHDWIDDGTGFDAAVVVSMNGPCELQNLGNWAFCTLSTYLMVTLRWIDGVSGSVLTPKRSNLHARLVPNVCPYCPMNNLFDGPEVQGTISELILSRLGLESQGASNVLYLIREVVKNFGGKKPRPTEPSQMFTYSRGNQLQWVRAEVKLSSYPLIVLLLSTVIGLFVGVVACWITLWLLQSMKRQHLTYLMRQLRLTQTRQSLQAADHSGTKKDATREHDPALLVTLVQQGVLISKVTKVLRHELPPRESQPFSCTIFFFIELAMEYLRRSIVFPLELFIYSLPVKEDAEDGVATSSVDTPTSAIGSSAADAASNERDAAGLLHTVPMKRFKVEFQKFCIQHGFVPHRNIEDHQLVLQMAGISIKKDISRTDSFMRLAWREIAASTMDVIELELHSKMDRFTDSVTLFLQTHCVATGQETDIIAVKELGVQYGAFCHRLRIPQEQRVQIQRNTQQVLQFGALLMPQQDAYCLEGLYAESKHVTREIPLDKMAMTLDEAKAKHANNAKELRDFSFRKMKVALREQVLLRSQAAMDSLIADCFMGVEIGLYRPRLLPHQWLHVGLKCIFCPYSKLWDILLPLMQLCAVTFLPLPLFMFAFAVQSSDRVMRPVEPEIDIFVWADVPYFASFDEVSLEKALNMRPIVKCLLMLLPFYYGIGSLALVCHITSLRAWDPAAFVTHTRLRRFFTGSFNVLCIFTLFVYASFMGMLAAWLLLGAILNPDQFLPYVSLKTMYTDMIEKMCEATTRMINEDLLKPVQEMLIPEEALDELQQAAVTRLGAMPGLGGMDASALLKSIANSDLESISAQLVAQPLMSSLGLSPQALKAVLKGDLNEVELHVSKALKVHSRKGRAVIRAILATCPPWNAVSPPPELLLAVEELAQEAGIPARLAVSVASFLFASKYKESQTTWNAAMEDFLEQILAMEVPRTDANGKRAKVLREMVGPDVLMCAIHLTLGDLRALVLLLERYWNTPASRALLNIVRWYSYSSGSDSGMEPSALASMRRDLATFSELVRNPFGLALPPQPACAGCTSIAACRHICCHALQGSIGH
ncbi:hypothetical protein CYMTET_34775, partial [Cymbomonas tetramitiformis]